MLPGLTRIELSGCNWMTGDIRESLMWLQDRLGEAFKSSELEWHLSPAFYSKLMQYCIDTDPLGKRGIQARVRDECRLAGRPYKIDPDVNIVALVDVNNNRYWEMV